MPIALRVIFGLSRGLDRGRLKGGLVKIEVDGCKLFKGGTHYSNYTIHIVDLVTLVDPEFGTIHL